MKKNKFAIILLFCSNFLFAQSNLIPNPGFENGSRTPRCINGGYVSSTPIEYDIYDWKVARAKTGDYKYSEPDWMDNILPHCDWASNDLPYTPITRLIYLEDRGGGSAKNQDAIRTGLISDMNGGEYNIFKISYLTWPGRKNGGIYTCCSQVRIYFTKFSTNWSRTWGNAIYSFPMYPPQYHFYNIHWFNQAIVLPPLGSFANKLHNIVIGCEHGNALIDYVELHENCESPVLIENKNYYGSNLPEKSGGYLRAGYDVGASSSNGNVIIHNGASIVFKAENLISLENGFESETGSIFDAIIESCNPASAYRHSTDTRFLESEEDTIPITIIDDTEETLECGSDSVTIIGLDGDTVSYSNYFWDFGNGITSTEKVARIFYDLPGDYLVTLILTDTIGATDTLSKTYIVPACSGNRYADNMQESTLENTALLIIPNPTSGNFTIQTNNIDAKNIFIYDFLGKTILEKTGVKESESTFDLSNQPKGVYTLKVLQGNKITAKKIVVM